MNKQLFILPLLLISLTGCEIYISPDSASIKKRPRPKTIPSATIPSAYPNYTNPTTTTSTKKVVVTEIQGTPTTQAAKKVVKPNPVKKLTQTLYTVKPYDTVFSIMRKTNANWSDIIRINSLEPPNYTIHPGQVLRLK